MEVQCRYCFQAETQTSPAGPLYIFKTSEAARREDAGSLLCLLLLLLFDYWAKLFNQLWNHKKAAVLHCSGTEPLLAVCCGFLLSGYRWMCTAMQISTSMVTPGPASVQKDSVWCEPCHALSQPEDVKVRPAGSAEGQNVCLHATSGISVVYVGYLGGQ